MLTCPCIYISIGISSMCTHVLVSIHAFSMHRLDHLVTELVVPRMRIGQPHSHAPVRRPGSCHVCVRAHATEVEIPGATSFSSIGVREKLAMMYSQLARYSLRHLRPSCFQGEDACLSRSWLGRGEMGGCIWCGRCMRRCLKGPVSVRASMGIEL